MLCEISELCGSINELDQALGPVLRWLSERAELHRGTLALLDDEQALIRVEAAHGLTPKEVRRAQLKIGQGITGRVIATGKPCGVLRISQDARFVDWAGITQKDLDPAFACVPIMGETSCIGALGAYKRDASPADLDHAIAILSIIAGLISPLARRHLRQYARQAPESLSETQLQPDNIIGRSKTMRHVFNLIGQVAHSDTSVLLLGESGTGKELVAQALHGFGSRPSGPFIKVNCAALPEGVIESELFGHEKGSFTGAIHQRKGRFEMAAGGTLFLDEIGDLSPSTQVKLLRVLQEGEFERVGGLESLHSDARIITATSRDLEGMIIDGLFRADLYYRLNVFPIWLPPLRDRKVDILLLTDHFIEMFNRAHNRGVKRISTSAIDMLMAYHWPGNVRELENCIERAVLIARDDVLLGHHLPPSLQTADSTDTPDSNGLKAKLSTLERELLLDALKTSRGNMAAAARSLQITERQMGLRIQRHALDPTRFKIHR